jgi:hypothetical protein
MKKLAALLAFIPALASAQTVPPPFTTQGAVPTITQWSNAWAGKLDAPLTAGTATTSGFAAGQLMVSDGAKVQGGSFTAGAFGASIFAPVASATGAVYGGNTSTTTVLDWNFNKPNTWSLWNSPALQIVNGLATANFRVYNTYTDASNGEWGALDWQTTPNVLTIGTQANGTGTARNVQFVVGGVNKLDWNLTTTNSWTSAGGLNAAGNISAPVLIASGVGGVVAAATYQSSGLTPTITGAGGTCATSTKVGGNQAGTVVLSGVCATGNTITWTGMNAQNNGMACDAEDRTTRTALFVQSASTTTGFTLTTGAVSSVANDVLQWKCMGY